MIFLLTLVFTFQQQPQAFGLIVKDFWRLLKLELNSKFVPALHSSVFHVGVYRNLCLSVKKKLKKNLMNKSNCTYFNTFFGFFIIILTSNKLLISSQRSWTKFISDNFGKIRSRIR